MYISTVFFNISEKNTKVPEPAVIDKYLPTKNVLFHLTRSY